MYSIYPHTDANGRYTGKEFEYDVNKLGGEYITYRKIGDRATNMPATVWYALGKDINESIKYKYDKCGNISEIRENGHLKTKCTYDSLNRLIREDNKYCGTTFVYSYDQNGNITERCEYRYTLKRGEELDEQCCLHYTYDYDGDKLKVYNDETFEYNVLGNPTIYRNRVMTWEKGKFLKRCGETTFAYNGAGQRISKGSITYTYDSDGRLLKQSNGLKFIYDTTGVAGLNYNGESYLYRKDVQGNIIAIIQWPNMIVARYEYDAWGNHVVTDKNGNPITSGIGVLNPFRYRSYYYDTETELYYLQTRYYDPELGRFISQDSIEYAAPETINGLNLYAYCGNNPVMNIDPTGRKFSGNIVQLVVSLWTYIGYSIASIFDKDIRDDMNLISWNPFNNKEDLVFQASKVSFFKGVPVIKTPDSFPGTFTFLWIFYKNSDKEINGVKHEWGHIWQQTYLGPIDYLLFVGLPSALQWGSWSKNNNYYGAPWETVADIFGGVSGWNGNYHTRKEKILAISHMIVARLFKFGSYFFGLG